MKDRAFGGGSGSENKAQEKEAGATENAKSVPNSAGAGAPPDGGAAADSGDAPAADTQVYDHESCDTGAR